MSVRYGKECPRCGAEDGDACGVNAGYVWSDWLGCACRKPVVPFVLDDCPACSGKHCGQCSTAALYRAGYRALAKIVRDEWPADRSLAEIGTTSRLLTAAELAVLRLLGDIEVST